MNHDPDAVSLMFISMIVGATLFFMSPFTPTELKIDGINYLKYKNAYYVENKSIEIKMNDKGVLEIKEVK